MERAPFLTIGIASYNYGKYLKKAFEQIKKQKFKDFELLYCDDGSTDNSVAIIENIMKENPNMNIRLIKGENEGLLTNRNRILEHAKGKYLFICDADDYMSDDCLEKLCTKAKKEDADCVIGGFCETDGEGNIYKTHVPPQNANPWIYIWHHAQIYKMELVKAHHIVFEKIPDDLCYVQRIHQHARKICFVSENLYYWVRHADSTSRDIDTNSDWHPNNLWKSIVACMLKIQDELTGEDNLWQLRYFLYKWYYFNVTDEPVKDRKALHRNIKTLQADMKKICTDYRKLSVLRRTLKETDTIFAKMAILVCWIIEGVGCITLLPMLRSVQQGMR